MPSQIFYETATRSVFCYWFVFFSMLFSVSERTISLLSNLSTNARGDILGRLLRKGRQLTADRCSFRRIITERGGNFGSRIVSYFGHWRKRLPHVRGNFQAPHKCQLSPSTMNQTLHHMVHEKMMTDVEETENFPLKNFPRVSLLSLFRSYIYPSVSRCIVILTLKATTQDQPLSGMNAESDDIFVSNEAVLFHPYIPRRFV